MDPRQPGVWPAQYQLRTADASSQYKPQATTSVLQEAPANPVEAASDNQLLALLHARLQYSTDPPANIGQAGGALLGLPGCDKPALSDPPKSLLCVPAARPSSSAQPRSRQPALTTVTPSPSSASGRRRGASSLGSPRRETAADAAMQCSAPQKDLAVGHLQRLTEAPTKPASNVLEAAPNTASGHVDVAAQTETRYDCCVVTHDLSAAQCLSDAPQSAGIQSQAGAGTVALTERLATVTSERDAAVASELEIRKALDAQARCWLYCTLLHSWKKRQMLAETAQSMEACKPAMLR